MAIISDPFNENNFESSSEWGYIVVFKMNFIKQDRYINCCVCKNIRNEWFQHPSTDLIINSNWRVSNIRIILNLLVALVCADRMMFAVRCFDCFPRGASHYFENGWRFKVKNQFIWTLQRACISYHRFGVPFSP